MEKRLRFHQISIPSTKLSRKILTISKMYCSHFYKNRKIAVVSLKSHIKAKSQQFTSKLSNLFAIIFGICWKSDDRVSFMFSSSLSGVSTFCKHFANIFGSSWLQHLEIFSSIIAAYVSGRLGWLPK